MPMRRQKGLRERTGNFSSTLRVPTSIGKPYLCATMIVSRVAIASLLVLVAAAPPAVDVTVTEGTSMAVAVSPDGRTLAIDLQGSIWTLPATGGAARRLTDGFDDARQPAWSPDG